MKEYGSEGIYRMQIDRRCDPVYKGLGARHEVLTSSGNQSDHLAGRSIGSKANPATPKRYSESCACSFIYGLKPALVQQNPRLTGFRRSLAGAAPRQICKSPARFGPVFEAEAFTRI